MVRALHCNPEVRSSNPLPCYQMDLCLVVPDSTPPCFVNSQLVSLLPVGIFSKFLFDLQYCYLISVSTICTAVLNTNTVFVISRSTGTNFRNEATRSRVTRMFSFNFSESVDSQLDSCHSCDQYLDKTIVP